MPMEAMQKDELETVSELSVRMRQAMRDIRQ